MLAHLRITIKTKTRATWRPTVLLIYSVAVHAGQIQVPCVEVSYWYPVDTCTHKVGSKHPGPPRRKRRHGKIHPRQNPMIMGSWVDQLRPSILSPPQVPPFIPSSLYSELIQANYRGPWGRVGGTDETSGSSLTTRGPGCKLALLRQGLSAVLPKSGFVSLFPENRGPFLWVFLKEPYDLGSTYGPLSFDENFHSGC